MRASVLLLALAVPVLACGGGDSVALNVNFDTLEDILAHADTIDRLAAAGPDSVNTFMPPSDPTPSEEERCQLGEWLACEQAR